MHGRRKRQGLGVSRTLGSGAVRGISGACQASISLSRKAYFVLLEAVGRDREGERYCGDRRGRDWQEDGTGVVQAVIRKLSANSKRDTKPRQ